VEEREETDTRQWQDSRVNDINTDSNLQGCSEGEENVGSSRRMTTVRPLKLDIPPNSYSPPLWEVIGPPEENEGPRRATSETFTAQQYAPCLSPHDHISSILISRPSRRLIPKSSYYYGPPPPDTAFGTDPVGQIGIHHPREIVRVERDYSGGEIIQFSAIYPLEFEGRVCLRVLWVILPHRSLEHELQITPTQFLESINAINEILISAHSLSHSCLDNMLAFFTLQLSRLMTTTHYEKVRSQN
jgi:hypothetical protein